MKLGAKNKKLIKYILLFLFMVKNTMAYEEAVYEVIQKFENFEKFEKI